MNRKDAERILELPANASAQSVRQAFERRASILGREREMAMTRSLRERLELDLAAARAARDYLLGASVQAVSAECADELPLTSPPQIDMVHGRTPLPFSTTGNSRVLDRYDLGEKLGSGGMGEVFAAFDRLTSQPVAIKFISERISSRADSLQRFLAEARLSCRLSHPNIVRTFDVHEAGGRHFITMELLEGQTLRQHIASRIAAGRTFDRPEVVRIMRQICEALAYAHKDLVHRDIKPENVWRCTDGTIKIMDFGVALDMAGADLAEATAALGTEGYRAPEQTTGSDPVDQRADQYSAACIAVELLASPAPCRPAQLRTDALSRRDPVSAVLDRALAGRATDRYETILAFESALRKALLEARWRRHMPLAAATAVMVAVAIGVAISYLGPDPNSAGLEVPVEPPVNPAILAHARISEARALLDSMDSLVEQTETHVAQIRGEIDRAQQRFDSGKIQTAKELADLALQRQLLDDATLVAERASSWALTGNERIAAEGHLGAADAAIESEQWSEGAAQAGRAIELLVASRSALSTTRQELASLRDLSSSILALKERVGAANGATAAGDLVSSLESRVEEARGALVTGDAVRARNLRLALTEALATSSPQLDRLLISHWAREADVALRAGRQSAAQQAITALERLDAAPAELRRLRGELAALARRAREKEALRLQEEQEAIELLREQEAYRPRRHGN